MEQSITFLCKDAEKHLKKSEILTDEAQQLILDSIKEEDLAPDTELILEIDLSYTYSCIARLFINIPDAHDACDIGYYKLPDCWYKYSLGRDMNPADFDHPAEWASVFLQRN